MNAEIQLTRELKANGFVLARQDKHKIYRRDDGRILVVPSTPSDFRWAKNALGDLQRVLAQPPRSEVLSVIELEKREEAIRLERQAKFKAGSGHTKQKSVGGNGFTYIDKIVPQLTPEQIEQSKAAAERARKMQEGNKRVRKLQASFVSFVRAGLELDYEAAFAKVKEIRRDEGRKVYDSCAAAIAAGGSIQLSSGTVIKHLPSFDEFLDENVRLNVLPARDMTRKGVEIAKSIAKQFKYGGGDSNAFFPMPTVSGDDPDEHAVLQRYHEWLELALTPEAWEEMMDSLTAPDAKETAA